MLDDKQDYDFRLRASHGTALRVQHTFAGADASEQRGSRKFLDIWIDDEWIERFVEIK